MGLAAVKGTVLEHQGTIDVTSTKGVGTTFRILLPVSDIEVPKETSNVTTQRGAHGRILVVDDEISVTKVVEMALTQGGYEVEVYQSGQAVIERCAAGPFDLVLLDVMMPDMDGVEVLQRLRAKTPSARVVLMTGHASESLEARMREFSDIVVLSKPFQPKELLLEIRKALAQS